MFRFHVGQKVVCINATIYQEEYSPLVVGRVYVVNAIGRCGGYDPYGNDAICDVLDVGVTNPFWKQWEGDHGFDAKRFRPLVTRQTDISIFTAMLNPQRQSEDA